MLRIKPAFEWATTASDAEKVWWSQRDLNPCLSLERTEETEEKQSDDDVRSSDE